MSKQIKSGTLQPYIIIIMRRYIYGIYMIQFLLYSYSTSLISQIWSRICSLFCIVLFGMGTHCPWQPASGTTVLFHVDFHCSTTVGLLWNRKLTYTRYFCLIDKMFSRLQARHSYSTRIKSIHSVWYLNNNLKQVHVYVSFALMIFKYISHWGGGILYCFIYAYRH